MMMGRKNLSYLFYHNSAELEEVSELPSEEVEVLEQPSEGVLGVRVEGVHSRVRDCWKGFRIGSTPKCL